MAATKKKRVAKAARSSFRNVASSKPATKAKLATKAKRVTKTKPAAKRATKAKPAPTPKPAGKPVDTREPVGDRVTLGEITTPSGTLAIFDIGLVGYLPREALEPAIVKATVPTDRPLPVLGTRVGQGRFASCWDHVAVVVGDGEVHGSKKLGEAGVDFARLVCMDHGALDHWQHEDSLDGKADFVFWGRDAPMLARVMNAPRLT
ncbi:MAG: hypothetical protein H0V17_34345, partial [Deltaproteobacteria bacterium]|nr:hypothetical protein [Deltaproteobacteria bacterium]